MTETDAELLEDKLELWKRSATSGNMEMRDYHKRAVSSLERLMFSDAATKAELDAARAEALCCDDINLNQPLAGIISDLQEDRERLRAGVVPCPDCLGSGLSTNMAGEPDDCPRCKGDTMVDARPAREIQLERAYEEAKAECHRRDQSRIEQEAIVARVWKALGSPTYEQCGGKTIDEIVAGMRAALSDLANASEGDDLIGWVRDTAREALPPFGGGKGRING